MKALKLAGYVAWFFMAFLIGIVMTFPMDGLKSTAVNFAEERLGKGAQGRHGVDPSVQIGSLSLSLLKFGVRAKNVHVQLASDNPDPGPALDLESVVVGVRPWSLPRDAKTIVIDAKGYGGSVDGTIKLDVKKSEVKEADVEIDDVDLGRMTILMDKLGVPIAGRVSADVELDFGDNPEKDAKGKIKLSGQQLALGPGTMKLGPMKFEVKIEQGPVDFGKLSGQIDVDQGKGVLKDVKLASNDINAEVVGEIFPKGRMQNSRLDLDGFIQLAPPLLEREKALQSGLELAEKFGGMGGVSLPKARDEEGRYFFSVKGTLGAVYPALATDNGRRAKQRGTKGGAAPSAAPERPRRDRPLPPRPTPTAPPIEAPMPDDTGEPPPPPKPEDAEG